MRSVKREVFHDDKVHDWWPELDFVKNLSTLFIKYTPADVSVPIVAAICVLILQGKFGVAD